MLWYAARGEVWMLAVLRKSEIEGQLQIGSVRISPLLSNAQNVWLPILYYRELLRWE